jgi:hypothetical protein
VMNVSQNACAILLTIAATLTACSSGREEVMEIEV